MNITPSLLTYASLILTIYYIFAMIGMEIFAGKIESNNSTTKNCANPKLIDTEFAK
jgi:two pore calcium channel protein 3